VTILWTSARTSGTVAHLALAEAGIACEPRFLSLRQGEHKAPAYLAINPKGEVPALQLPSGAVITEIPAILAWAHATSPKAGLFAQEAEAYAAGVERVAELHWTLARSIGAAFAPARFAPGLDEAGQAALRAAAQARFEGALARFEERLGAAPFLGGERPDASDFFLWFTSRCAIWMKRPMEAFPRLVAQAAALEARPRIAAALAREAA
jgi:glutathione S-transferase